MNITTFSRLWGKCMKVLISLKDPTAARKTLNHIHTLDNVPAGTPPDQYMVGKPYDLVLIEDRLEDLESIKLADPRTEVIILVDDEDIGVEALRSGAFAYILRPLDEEILKEAVNNAGELMTLRKETGELERLLVDKYRFAGIIAKNSKMLEIIDLIRRLAPHFQTVTITGETGTGKEVIARALHDLSPHSDRPFVTCNCGALVESLLESELFGHVKGSFTGAITDKMGLFEAAREGTILLDEIGELPLSIQPKFLRVLQGGEFRRVGSDRISTARCRVIAATNKDLADEVRKGNFREDLFYRLTPLTIKVPPLRERRDDIPLLCRSFLEKFNSKTKKRVAGISREAQSAIMSYNWLGNVRELENVIEQAAILTDETFIRFSDLPVHIRESGHGPSADSILLDDVIKGHIERVLAQCSGNRSRTARALGLSRRSLLRRLEKYLIQ